MEDFKAVVAWAISPLILTFFLQIGGWVSWFFLKRRRLALSLWGGSLVLLLVGSLPVLSFETSRSREYRYAPLDLEEGLRPDRPVLAVVMGTGFNPDPWLPRNSQVSGTAHVRFLEAVRIYRSRSDVRILVSVANDEADPAEKREFLAEMIRLFGLDPDRVGLMTEAQSTEDEARLTRERMKEGEQVVIATSAGHMPRSMDLFARAGLDPIAAPCEYWHPRKGSPTEKKWKQWIPSSGGIGATRQMLYEAIASVWTKVKG